MQFHNQDCLAAPEACMCAFFNEKNVPKDPKLKNFSSSIFYLWLTSSLQLVSAVEELSIEPLLIQGAAASFLTPQQKQHNTHKKSALVSGSETDCLQFCRR